MHEPQLREGGFGNLEQEKQLKLFNERFCDRLIEDSAKKELSSSRDYLALIDDYTEELQPVGNRDGIHGGSPGTTHSKFETTDGEVWMAKSYPKDRLHRALVDEVAANVADQIGLTTVMSAKIGKIDGRAYSFVKWEETTGSIWEVIQKLQLEEDDNGSFAEKLRKDQLISIVKEHVLDWLISNHDAHPGHFLRKNDKDLMCIDKAQAFKYLGESEERLAVDYDPNEKYNGHQNLYYMPIYNSVWQSIVDEKADLSIEEAWDEVEQVLIRVEAISDDEYEKVLQTYAVFRFEVIASEEDSRLSKDDFINLAVARKKNIRKDFEDFINALKTFNKDI